MPVKKVNQSDWIQAALKALRDRGVASIEVDRLAKTLGVTKGSFYHHFKDRAELLDCTLDRWFIDYNQKLIEELLASECSPREKLDNLLDAVDRRKLYAPELSIHAWAAQDKNARKVVRKAIAMRIEAISKIVSEIVPGEKRIDMIARTLATYHSFQHVTNFGLSAKDRREVRQMQLAWLLDDLPKK